jgi:hypothetical protein
MKDAKDKRTDSIQGVRTKAWPTLTGGVPVSGCDCSRREASLAYCRPVVDLDWNKQRCRAEAACRLSFPYHRTASGVSEGRLAVSS